MGRQRKSGAEEAIELVAKFPWWVGASLAVFSFVFLHILASKPVVVQTPTAEGLTSAFRGQLIKVFAQFGQYVLPLICGIGALISAIKAAQSKKVYDRVASSPTTAALNSITWREFENLVGEYFRRQGFAVNWQGGQGADGGVDLVLRNKGEMYLVQCKQWKAYKVGVQPVRELYGVMAARGAAGGYVVTSGVFTEEAKEFARGLNVELINGGQLRRRIDGVREEAVVQAPPLLQAPACPKCGSQMKKRVARQGAQASNEFWGCSTYPKCNGILPLQQSPQEPGISPSVETAKKSCPVCGGELVLRQFQSGPKAGQEFLGCIPCRKGWPFNGDVAA